MDANEFRSAAKQLVDYIADYLENIRERPVLPSVQPGYITDLIPDSAPEDGEQWDSIFTDIERVIMPGVSINSIFIIIIIIIQFRKTIENIDIYNKLKIF